jgi:superfamily I DNA/RNA helicase
VTAGLLVILAPSAAAATALQRRAEQACGLGVEVRAFTVRGFAHAVAEPGLRAVGRRAWRARHAVASVVTLLGSERARGLRLPQGLRRGPVAVALARSLEELRLAGVSPEALEIASAAQPQRDDAERLASLAALHRELLAIVDGGFADDAAFLRLAGAGVAVAPWLRGAEFLVQGPLDLAGLEHDLLLSVAASFPVRVVGPPRPGSEPDSRFDRWAAGVPHRSTPLADAAMAALTQAPRPQGLACLRERLFAAPSGKAVSDDSVVTFVAADDEAEAEAIADHLLAAARRGVAFAEMGVALEDPEGAAPGFVERLRRKGVPVRRHSPSPLSRGLCTRSLLMLLACRGLRRSAVLAFLGRAAVPYAEILGPGCAPSIERWESICVEAGVGTGLERWIIGLRSLAEALSSGNAGSMSDRPERLRRAEEAEALLRLVELISATLDSLAGDASWAHWSGRLHDVVDQWIGPGPDRSTLVAAIADLEDVGSLSSWAPVPATKVRWDLAETVLRAHLDELRLRPEEGGVNGVHVGWPALLAGLPLRVLALPGLSEGALRPPRDPVLLDADRSAISIRPPQPARRAHTEQLPLFPEAPPATLDAKEERRSWQRRLFHGLVSQPSERLVLSYARSAEAEGTSKLPSPLLLAAVSAVRGRDARLVDLGAPGEQDDFQARRLSGGRTRGRHAREAVVIRGGAGSGKTTLLLDRVEGLVLSGQAQLREIALVAATPVTAQAMRHEIRARFESARDSRELADTARQRAARALEDLEDAQIATLPHLCACLLAERPLECGMVPGFRVVGETESARLFQEAWEEWLAHRRGQGDNVAAAASAIGVPIDGGPTSLRSLAERLVEHRDLRPLVAPQEPDAMALDQQVAVKASRARLLAAKARGDALAESLEELADFADRGRFLSGVALAQHLDGLPSPAPADFNPGRWLSAEAVEAARAVLAWATEAGAAWRAARSEALHARILKALGGALMLYEERKTALGVLDPLDPPLELRRALQESEPLRRRIRNRFSHVFVDGLQDAELLEVELLLALAPPGGKGIVVAGDPASAAGGSPRSDPALFRRFALAAGRSVIDLGICHRSRPAIVRFVNGVFEEIMRPVEEGEEPHFVPLREAPGPPEGPAVLAIRLNAQDGGAEAVRIAEAEAVVELALRIAAGALRVRDASTGCARSSRKGDLVVLARGRQYAEAFARAARDRGLDLGGFWSQASARLLEIQEARGIDAPVVALLGAADVEPVGVHAVRLWEEGAVALGLRDGCQPPRWDTLRWPEEQRLSAQRVRLLYVACTRARDLLVLPHAAPPPEGALLNPLLPQPDRGAGGEVLAESVEALGDALAATSVVGS